MLPLQGSPRQRLLPLSAISPLAFSSCAPIPAPHRSHSHPNSSPPLLPSSIPHHLSLFLVHCARSFTPSIVLVLFFLLLTAVRPHYYCALFHSVEPLMLNFVTSSRNLLSSVVLWALVFGDELGTVCSQLVRINIRVKSKGCSCGTCEFVELSCLDLSIAHYWAVRFYLIFFLFSYTYAKSTLFFITTSPSLPLHRFQSPWEWTSVWLWQRGVEISPIGSWGFSLCGFPGAQQTGEAPAILALRGHSSGNKPVEFRTRVIVR